jgi:hypothetical protein
MCFELTTHHSHNSRQQSASKAPIETLSISAEAVDDSLATTQASQPGLSRRPFRCLKRKCMLSDRWASAMTIKTIARVVKTQSGLA